MSVELAVDGVTVAFGGLKALREASLSFAAGRITGLIGPNGSGKSTLVNTMSGQLAPTAGRVWLGGDVITGLRTDQIAARGLARTYQIPRVPPQLTVQEMISVPFAYIKRQAMPIAGLEEPAAIADFCGLAPVFKRRCGLLSVTDLRRLEIARALACGPKVLLLDEVMAGLSHTDALEVVEIIRRVHAAGVTIVIIEHLMRIIAGLCDSVVVLNSGSVLSSGAPRAVLAEPAVREAYLGKGFKL
jgi:branched-chain amino acid transport system ATP-binding protein